MLKRFLLVLIIMLVVFPSSAQDSWYVYLIDRGTNTLYRIQADGSQVTYDLGIGASPDHGLTAWDMGIANQHEWVAFCAYHRVDDVTPATQAFYVRDLAAQNNLVEMDLGATFGCVAGKFNEDDSLLAVSLVNNVGMMPGGDTTKPAWQLLLIDPQTGTVVHELNANMLSVYEDGLSMLAQVRYFVGNTLIFAALPYPGEFSYDVPAYSWDITTGAVGKIPNWGKPGIDTLPEVGELIWTEYNESLPVGEPMGPIPTNNVVMLANKTGEARIIYHSPDALITNTVFINGGREIAILLTPEYNPDTPPEDMGFSYWVALDRTGNVRPLHESPYFAQIIDAPDGYMVFDMQMPAGGTASYQLISYTNGVENVLFSVTPEQDMGWNVVWSAPTPLASDLQSFPTWSN